MPYTIKQLREWSVFRGTPRGEVPARPVDGPFIDRIRDAWAVLRGHADAFTWNHDPR